MSETRAISTTWSRELASSFLFHLQGKALKEIHAILTETLACFLPGRAKDLSAPRVILFRKEINAILTVTLVYFLPGRAKDLSAPHVSLS